jgi:hypothetical protein
MFIDPEIGPPRRGHSGENLLIHVLLTWAGIATVVGVIGFIEWALTV